jgi:hypothetical protein
VLERKARIRTGEKEGNRDWEEYGLEEGREYESERMRGKGTGDNKGNWSWEKEGKKDWGWWREKGMERRTGIGLGEKEGKDEWVKFPGKTKQGVLSSQMITSHDNTRW